MHRSDSDGEIVTDDDFVLDARRSVPTIHRNGSTYWREEIAAGEGGVVDGGAAAVAGVSRADDGRFVGMLRGWGRVSCYPAGRRQETRRVVDGLPR